MRYPVYLWAKYPALVSIYERDGTVAISTGGIEMGQGLNTKVIGEWNGKCLETISILQK